MTPSKKNAETLSNGQSGFWGEVQARAKDEIGIWAAQKFFEMGLFSNAESRRRAAEQHILLLHKAHELGDETAGKKALGLAASFGLFDATQLTWVLSPPSRKPSGPGIFGYQTRLRQWLNDWMIFDEFSAIREEWRRAPITKGLRRGKSLDDVAAELEQRLQNARAHKLDEIQTEWYEAIAERLKSKSKCPSGLMKAKGLREARERHRKRFFKGELKR